MPTGRSIHCFGCSFPIAEPKTSTYYCVLASVRGGSISICNKHVQPSLHSVTACGVAYRRYDSKLSHAYRDMWNPHQRRQNQWDWHDLSHRRASRLAKAIEPLFDSPYQEAGQANTNTITTQPKWLRVSFSLEIRKMKRRHAAGS